MLEVESQDAKSPSVRIPRCPKTIMPKAKSQKP
jgi:hypothetical protein